MIRPAPLVLPPEILEQHVVALGKTGAGKSSVLRHLVEHLLANKKPVCVVDPKGDWYGLKSSPDGHGPGFPVILFGDFKNNVKGDIPLIPRGRIDDESFDVAPAAKHVASLVVGGNRPAVVGMRGWTQGSMTKFWIDFASTIFNQASGEFYLVIDEVHNFAPKGKLLGIDANKALHWTNRLINEGRGLGLTALIASQRPQKVHNDTLTACETLIALRVVHTADRKAIEEWIKGCGDEKRGTAVLNSLAGQAKGQGQVWSPEAGFGPQQIQFPMFKTFDSFAPSQRQVSVSEKGWASVDLDEVKRQLSDVIEKASADDPDLLRQANTKLQTEIFKLQRAQQPRAEDSERIKALEAEVEKLRAATTKSIDSSLKRIETIVPKAEALVQEAHKTAETIRSLITDAKTNGHSAPTFSAGLPPPTSVVLPVSAPALPSSPLQVTQQRQQSTSSAKGITGGAKRMLEALANNPNGRLTRSQLGTLARIKMSGGTAGDYISRLRVHGLIVDHTDGFAITQAGRDYIGIKTPRPKTSDEILQMWRSVPGISGGCRRMLEILYSLRKYGICQIESLGMTIRGQGLSRSDLAKYAGVEESGGTFGDYLSRLRSNGLIMEQGGMIYASDSFFVGTK